MHVGTETGGVAEMASSIPGAGVGTYTALGLSPSQQFREN